MPTATERRESLRARLRTVQQRRLLARFYTPFDGSSWNGFVVGVGAAFVALLVVDGNLRYAGVVCFRLQDVRRLQPVPHPAFVQACLGWRGERRPRLLRLRLDDTAGALQSIARAFPLVTIHRERLHPDECNIGRLAGLTATTFGLHEIAPGAVWERAVTTYRLRDVTCIEGGGDYEAALWHIGGEPPAPKA